MALSELKQVDLITAIDVIDRILLKYPSDATHFCEAGKFYLALHLQDQTLSISQLISQQQSDIDFFLQNALHYFHQAAELQSGLAHHYLGHLYQNGIGVKDDLTQALQHFEQAVAHGYFLSLQRIGYFYETGMVVQKDPQKAIECYEKVVDQGLLTKEQRVVTSFGLYNKAPPIKRAVLKNYFSYNNKVIQDLLSDVSTKLEGGLVVALTNLANFYLKHPDMPQAKLKIHNYLNEASRLNCPLAQVLLGKLYQKGLHLKQDDVCALQLYKRSAEQGHAPAQVRLGHYYLSGAGGLQKDEVSAKHYFELSAQQENANAYVSLGYCYHNGLGAEINFEKALFYYQKAANENHPVGLRNLGVLYYKGQGVEEDRERARQLWDQAENLSRTSL
jgi:TPR repeat protein